MPFLRAIQMNVFEDGLNAAPGAVGFRAEFKTELDALLAALGTDEGGEHFFGLGAARDFGTLPRAFPITSTDAFFAPLDVLYSCLYHTLGGEVQIGTAGAAPAADAAPIGNTLRRSDEYPPFVPSAV